MTERKNGEVIISQSEKNPIKEDSLAVEAAKAIAEENSTTVVVCEYPKSPDKYPSKPKKRKSSDKR